MPILEQSSARIAKQNGKYHRILDAAYTLFLERGTEEVAISEISERAGVAKGTFYLYFKDKEQLKEHLVVQKSHELFQQALSALRQTPIHHFDSQVVFIVNYILDVLTQNTAALKIISKDLSFGVFSERLSEFFTDDDMDVVGILIKAAERDEIQLKNPKILLYMIIELSSSTCFSCILKSEPLEISVFKPYLFEAIRQLIRADIRQCPSQNGHFLPK